jgi:PhzF family phenazine biosynthesis protein
MSQAIFQIDAFTDRRFGGNPAGVCILEKQADERWMQDVAMEMNVAETAFVHPIEQGWSLRWFTPTLEVDLCGHATIATTHAMLETGRLRDEEAVYFVTKSGRLSARRHDGWIELDFPSTPAAPITPPPGLTEALGAELKFVGRSRFDYLVELKSSAIVRDLRPDMARLARIQSRGVIITAAGDEPDVDFVSRFFAPQSGVDEDPVTGSSHCALAPYWSGRAGKTAMMARQLSRRGGVIRVRLAGDRVFIAGQAITTLRGELV